jgi:hypothetical protein
MIIVKCNGCGIFIDESENSEYLPEPGEVNLCGYCAEQKQAKE